MIPLGGGGAGGFTKDPLIEGGAEMFSLVSLCTRTSLDANGMQMTFVSDKTYSDLDVYLNDLHIKLASTFRDMLDGKKGINFWVGL